MSGVVVVAGIVGLLILIGLAGLVYERLHKGGDHSITDERRANQTLRYYRDVGDSTNSGGW